MSKLEELMNLLCAMPEAKGLPEHFLKNIIKIGSETSKLNDSKWVKKMLNNAQKVHEQALIAQQKKVEKKLNNQIASREVKSQQNNSKEERIKEFNEFLSKLPKFENATTTFPNIKRTALFAIKKNYGTWTLQAMSILNDTNAIHSFWAIQFAAALHKTGIKKVVQIITSNENLYESIINSDLFKESENERNRVYNEIKKYELSIVEVKRERKRKQKEEKGM